MPELPNESPPPEVKPTALAIEQELGIPLERNRAYVIIVEHVEDEQLRLTVSRSPALPHWQVKGLLREGEAVVDKERTE